MYVSLGGQAYCRVYERTDVPALGYEDANEEEGEEYACADPSVCSVRRAFVQVGLVYLTTQVSNWSSEHSRPFSWRW